MTKKRLDQLLVQKNMAESREKAQSMIHAGLISVNQKKETKPGHKFLEESEINIKEKNLYVSRGGIKIEEAYKKFNFNIKNKICMDIGSSTGGFTDFMLQHNAKKIYAIDCGTNQLHWKLRNNDSVIVMEKTNARYLKNKDIPELVDLCTIDVSFISIKKILPAIYPLLEKEGKIISLIKPQFEAGREYIQKGGVVIDPMIHQKIIDDIRTFGEKELALSWIDICPSPIKGPAGNTEFLVYWKMD